MARRRTGSGSPPPLPTGDEKTARVRAMFDTIAPRYDLINRLMTFGLDQAWRRNTVAALALPADALVLDLACGTGDLSRLALRRGYRVVGTDLSAGMLGANGAATPLVEADGSRLPFVDGAFDGLVCGYALRNFTDLAATLAESARVLRPGGRLAVLEVDTPSAPALARRLRPLVHQGRPRARGGALGQGRLPVPAAVGRIPAPHARPASHAAHGGVLRRGDPAPGRRPEPDGGGHPHRRTVTGTGTAGTAGTALHARTVALEYGPDALEFDGSPTVLFDRPGLTLVGWGTALLVPAGEAAARTRRHPVRRPGRHAGVGARRPRRAAVQRRLQWPCRRAALHHGDLARRRRGDAALGHRGRAGRRGAARHRRALRRRHLAVRHHAGRARGSGRGSGRDRPEHCHGLGGLRGHGRRRRGGDGAAGGRAAQSGPVPAGGGRSLAARSPSRPPCAGCGRANPIAPSSPCPSPHGSFFGASPELLVAAARVQGVEPSPGRHRAPGRHRPDRRRRPARPRRVDQEPRRAPLRRRGHRRRADARSARSCRSRPSRPLVAFRSVAHLGHAHRGPAGPPRRECSTCCEPLHPTPAVGGTPAPRGPGLHRGARARRHGATGPARSGGSAPAATASG